MKTTICLCLFVIASAIGQPAALQSEVKRFYTAAHDIDITALTEMLCGTDENRYAILDSHFQNDELKFRYVETNAKYQYGAAKTIEGKTYYPINFRNVIRITYFNPIDVSAKKAELKAKFNAQEITYNQARNAFMIVYTAKMVAVRNDKWQFVFLDHTMPNISTGCLTDAVKTELGL